MTGVGVLVIGYGNPLRGDDGIGRHAAELLAGDPPLDGAEVLTSHQLVPELAEDISRASLVVLIDASLQGEPGSLSVRRIEPHPATPRPGRTISTRRPWRTWPRPSTARRRRWCW